MALYYGGGVMIGKWINQGINGYCEYTQRQKEENEEKERQAYFKRQRLQQIRELQEKKRMIREAIQKKRKVEEAMNNLPIHEQENIKEVLTQIEDDDKIEIFKSINIDEITRQNIARHKKTTSHLSKAKSIKYEFINDE